MVGQHILANVVLLHHEHMLGSVREEMVGDLGL